MFGNITDNVLFFFVIYVFPILNIKVYSFCKKISPQKNSFKVFFNPVVQYVWQIKYKFH